MTDKPLGDLEAKVMKTVWSLGRGTVHEVRKALPGRRRLAYTTVLTTLRNLERKGFLTHEVEGRSHVYLPAVEEGEVKRTNIRDLLDRLFDGSPLRLVETLFTEEELGAEEVEAIEGMIRDLREREDRDG
jgi:predicted transcriptional regulator